MTACEDCRKLHRVIRDLTDSETRLAEIVSGQETQLRQSAATIAQLRRELAVAMEAEPGADEIRRVLEHWRRQTGHPKAKIPLTGKRGRLVRARLRDKFTADDLCAAVDGLARYPYVGPTGRTETGNPDQRYDDLEIAMRDESNVERFIELARRPVLTDQDRRDIASIQRGTAAAQSRRPLPKLPTPPRPRGDVQTVLDALTQRGLAWRPAGHGRFSAQCPCHEDRTPSLGLVELEGGGVGAKCLGCQAGAWEVCEALGLHWSTFGKDEARAA